MKAKSLLFASFLVLILACVACGKKNEPQPDPQKELYATVVASSINIRMQPTTQSSIIGGLTAGRKVQILATEENGESQTYDGKTSAKWYNIKYTPTTGDPVYGWVASVFLTDPVSE